MKASSTKMILWTATATAILAAGPAVGEKREILIGAQCDRTGPTQIVGVSLCPLHDS